MAGTDGRSVKELGQETGLSGGAIWVAIGRLRTRHLLIRFIAEHDQDTIRFRLDPKRQYQPETRKTKIVHDAPKPKRDGSDLAECWPSVIGTYQSLTGEGE